MNKSESIGVTAIELLRNRDAVYLKESYKEVYPMIESFVLKNTGSSDDAQDITQDAFYILFDKVKYGDFELTSKLSTYIYGIARHLWLKKIAKKEVDLSALKNEEEYYDLPDEDHQKFERIKKLEWAIDQLGEPCKTIIVQFYFFQKSMKDLATLLHYSNAENAKNQKYKCFNRLKKIAVK